MCWTWQDEQSWQEWQGQAVWGEDHGRFHWRCQGGCDYEPVLLPNEDSGTSLLQMEAVHYPNIARDRGNVPC